MTIPASKPLGLATNRSLVEDIKFNTRQVSQSTRTGKISQDLTSSPPIKFDTLSLSEDAQNLANYQGKSLNLADGKYSIAAEVPKDSTALTLASAVMKSGRTLVIDKILYTDGKNNQNGTSLFGFRANVYRPEGSLEYSFILKRDTIINENEDGSISVKNYVKGMETDGDDLIIGQEGKNISGGKGNDSIIEISAEVYKGRTNTRLKNATIEGGEGSDSIYIVANEQSSIATVDTGSGDDIVTIEGDFYHKAIKTGSGKDEINLKGKLYHSTIDTGLGDDTINISGRLSGTVYSNIDTGGGDDMIRAVSNHSSISGTINTGDGNDIISTIGNHSSISGTINTGDGNDIISTTGNHSGISGTINTGDGNDIISTTDDDSSISGTITTGDGEDVISTIGNHSSISGTITTGDGDDTINASGESLFLTGFIDTGTGDDIIDIAGSDTFISGKVHTGTGDDTILARSMRKTIDTGPGSDTINVEHVAYGKIHMGDGDDVLNVGHGGISGTKVDAGAGNDTVVTKEDLVHSQINTGSGNDSVTVNDIYNSSINLGSGDDNLTARLIMHQSAIRGGDGDDRFKILASVIDTFFDTGRGNDMVHIAGDLINSVLTMGKGNSNSVSIGGGVSHSTISGASHGSLWINGKRVDTM